MTRDDPCWVVIENSKVPGRQNAIDVDGTQNPQNGASLLSKINN